MAIDKLKRVMWRLEELNQKTFLKKDIERAIIMECGYDQRTITKVIKILKKLEWIKQLRHVYWIEKRDFD